MAATNSLQQAQPRAFFVLTSFPLLFFFFFFFTFLSLLFSLGICNEMMARNEKNEVTHWQWKRGERRYCLFSNELWGMPLFH